MGDSKTAAVPCYPAGMPIYMEISRLHRCVTIVARGGIAPDEIMGAAANLLEARVPEFAKIVDLLDATTEVNPEQVARIAQLLRGTPEVKRGPVAFMVDRKRGEFARAFAATETGERPVTVVHSLRDAREWLARNEKATAPGSSPWTDPGRQGVMFRRGQRRELPVRDRPAYAAD